MTPQQMLELVELLRPHRDDAEFICLLEMVWHVLILDLSCHLERPGFAAMEAASEFAYHCDPEGYEYWCEQESGEVKEC